MEPKPEVRAFLSFLRRKVDELEKGRQVPIEGLVELTGRADVLRATWHAEAEVPEPEESYEMERLLERLIRAAR